MQSILILLSNINFIMGELDKIERKIEDYNYDKVESKIEKYNFDKVNAGVN